MKIQLKNGVTLNCNLVYLGEDRITVRILSKGKRPKYKNFDLADVYCIRSLDCNLRVRHRRNMVLPCGIGTKKFCRIFSVPSSDDPLDTVVICPFCGNKTLYRNTFIGEKGVMFCCNCEEEALNKLAALDFGEKFDINELQPYALDWRDVKND